MVDQLYESKSGVGLAGPVPPGSLIFLVDQLNVNEKLAWRSVNEKAFISSRPGAVQMTNIPLWLAWRSANEEDFICGWPCAVQIKKMSFVDGLAQCK